MPTSTATSRPLFGRPPSYSKRKKSRAFLAGVAAYGKGETLGECPKEFKPRMGDSALYDSYRHGYLSAKTAHLS